MRAKPDVALAVQTNDVLGECPVWCPREQALYWGDLFRPALHRFEPASGALQTWLPPEKFGSFALREQGGMILATRSGICFFDPPTGTLERICEPEADRPGNLLNDGKCDRRGRFWVGSMDKRLKERTGALYRVDPDRSWQRMEPWVWLSNGLAFRADDRVLYHTDSTDRCIYAYDFDLERGTIRNRREHASARDLPGVPDGMTIDEEGCLWSAQWGASRVVRYAPDGRVAGTVELPTARPTSCMFGGPRLDVLYVTSGFFRLSEAERAAQPWAGGLLAIDVGVRGLPEPRFAG